MKKTINGKIYNTETAKGIDKWDNGLPVSDFCWTEETLYKKKTGEYFLYCESGAMGKYAKYNDDGSVGYGECILPISNEEADEWLSGTKGIDMFL